MIYKILTTNEDGTVIYARIDDDGKCRLTCTEDYPPFKEWIAEGGIVIDNASSGTEAEGGEVIDNPRSDNPPTE